MSYRVSADELQFMSMLENLTGTLPKDCVIDSENRLIAVVQQRDIGRFIGRGGSVIRELRQKLQRDVDVVQWAEDLEGFARNTVQPARVSSVEVIEKKEGKKTIIITVPQGDRGKAIGKGGRTISRAKLLLRRHFGIENVVIKS
ncbi:MAG: NusA-like transcription termination signal-binding factor [Candidatus Odinarchaeota archaeon]